MGYSAIHNRKKLSDAEISIFCQQLGMVVKAGLPIHYGIAILRDEASDDKTQAHFQDIYIPMKKGASLYTSIVDLGIFPTYMVHMVHLGEETGRLEEVFDSLSAYYEREAEIRVGVRHALIYPFVMTWMMLLILGVILARIVPVFSNIYEELIGELSGVALLLQNISDVLRNYSLVFFIIFISVIGIGVLIYKTTFGKILFQGKGLSLSIATSRFANCMYLALSSGLDTDLALELAEKMVDNPYMQDKIAKCKLRMHHGETFVDSLIHSGVFSRLYSGLLQIAAKTGSMVDAMQRIGQAYEEETDRQMRRILTVLEPLLIVIVSIFIALILFVFIIPILNIIV